MAKGRKVAPGSYVDNGVSCTMDAPFSGAAKSRMGQGGGQYGANHAPFDHPQSMGGGSIPTKFFDPMSPVPATTANAGSATPIMQPTQDVGQRRFRR